MRRFLLCFAALALVAAGCGDDDTDPAASGDASPVTTEDTATTSELSTTSSTDAASDDGAVDLAQSCTSPDGFTISYPADWESVSDCGQFGPAPLDEPEPATDERTGIVSAYVDAVPFETVSTPSEGDRTRAVTTVDGRQAVRIESTVTGEGLYPEGTDTVRWVVDLAIGADDGPGTLFVDAFDLAYEIDFDDAVPVLDRMARSLEIDVGDEPQAEGVVARYEGGGTPFTVAAAGAATNPSTCLRLLEQDGIACVEAVETPDGVALTSIDSPSGPITVGITGGEVFAVDFQASGDTFTYLPAPYPGRDSNGFAVPIAPADMASVTLRDIAGNALGEVPIEEATRPADP